MDIKEFMLPCPIRKVFRVDCLGCGSQRAVIMVFEGRFSEAFHLYPAVYTLLIFFAVLGVSIINKKRSYGNMLIFLAAVNLFIMIASYFYKHV